MERKGKRGTKDDTGFWLEPRKTGLPLPEMGGLGEEGPKFHLGQGKLEIPRCRYQFLKIKSTRGKRVFISTVVQVNDAGPGPSLVSAKRASSGFLLPGPWATQNP